MTADTRCYICSSDKFVDNHHYDCKKGTFGRVPLTWGNLKAWIL